MLIEKLKKESPWIDNDNRIWLSSSIAFFRNIEKFNFPGKLSTEKLKGILSLISEEIFKLKELKQATLFRGEVLTPIEKEFLAEHFLSTENLHQAQSGEAFIIDNGGEFLATLNIHNHLHLHLSEHKGDIESTWNRLVKMETTIGKALNYAFSQRFGFLTADPSNAGTGMEVTVYLQLPALVHAEQIDEALEKYANDTVVITGMQGSPTELIGDILMVRNNYSIGVSEEKILTSIRNFTTKIMLEENALRSKIKKEDDADIKDRISRAYGILIHSYQLEPIEALNALSLLKLGIHFDWVKGIDTKEVNRLFFNCRRAHLLDACGQQNAAEVLPHKRAEFVHEALKKVSLAI